MAFDKSKFIGKFVEEARDHISKINDGLLALEKNPRETESLNQIFRSAHTIKGSSRIMSFTRISELTHKLEDALGALREEKIEPSAPLFSLLFATTDRVSLMIDEVQKDGDVSSDGTLFCENLERAILGEPFSARQDDHTRTPSPKAEAIPATSKTDEHALPKSEEKLPQAKDAPHSEPQKTAAPVESIRVGADKLDNTIKVMGEILSNHNLMKHSLSELDFLKTASQACVEQLTKLFGDGVKRNPETDQLITKVGNLHLKIKKLASKTRDTLNLQDLLTDDLRDKVLRMRMLPLSTVLDSFPRLVRDISINSGKEIDFKVEGTETELDKKIIEKIGDPLLHMIRNSIDHGIESPDDRRKNGKPAKGNIHISASYEGGYALIQVIDDGGGIPVEKIKEKALQRKLYTEDVLNAMPRSQIMNLIFQPGFSTSPIITDLSGRGVGMDVVKETIIEQLKGSIQTESEEGQYTRFTLRVPLTLAILRVLIVALAEDLFAFPLSSITEIIKISVDDIIDVVNQKAIRLREKIIPLVNLSRILELPQGEQTPETLVVLLAMGSEKLGVMVDTLISEENIEIKPLPGHMKNIEVIAGASISGKSEIISLLHVPKIFELAKHVKERQPFDHAFPEEKQPRHILVVDDSVNTREIEKSILESYGYEVDIACDGENALEKTSEVLYDLVVTDIEMPRLDGFSLCERLRKDERYKMVPIIIVSSRDKPEDKRRGIEVGADAYIVKGHFDQSNLLDTVQNLLL